MALVALVILLAIVEYMIFGFMVGRARGKYGIRAPAITGHPVFERTFRVQQNTLEGLAIFLPGLWFFGQYFGAVWAFWLGVVGIAGRALYAVSYIQAAEKRGPGAGICGIVNIVLIVGALIGAVRAVI